MKTGEKEDGKDGWMDGWMDNPLMHPCPIKVLISFKNLTECFKSYKGHSFEKALFHDPGIEGREEVNEE